MIVNSSEWLFHSLYNSLYNSLYSMSADLRSVLWCSAAGYQIWMDWI